MRVRRGILLLALMLLLAQPVIRAHATDPSGNPVVALAGDIACMPGAPVGAATCHQAATSDLLLNPTYDAVVPLGDNQYELGTLKQFQSSYHPSWGRALALTFPVIGNHEYQTASASGYFDYFNGRNPGGIVRPTGARTKAYYSYNLGTWHIVVLNSNCKHVSADGTIAGGCGTSSPQGQWLKTDLAQNNAKCTMAVWHHPRYSSHANNKSLTTGFWTLLYNDNADVVVNGHAHHYERFAPQNKNQVLDPSRGLVEFVVGTGGHSLMQLAKPQPNSVAKSNTTFGILEMTLRPTGYDFRFLPEVGGTFTDSGTITCH